MIEVVSYPADLSAWDRRNPRFYFELYGETRPFVDSAYAQVQATPDDTSDNLADSLIYQYWWTIGHDGDPDELRDFWSQLRDDPAARVYMYFPLTPGWRVKELVATVKYLEPFHEHLSVWHKLSNEFTTVIGPAMSGLGDVASAIPTLAGAGSVLSAIGKVQVNSISPQAPGFEWAVSKVTSVWPGAGVVEGVMWRLPKRMFVDLGGRLTGSLALSFVPAQRQQPGKVALKNAPAVEQGAIRAHAVVRGPHLSDETWVPGQRECIELQVLPQIAPEAPEGREGRAGRDRSERHRPGPASGAS